MGSTKEQLYDSLKSRGWIENKDGSWSRPRANSDLGAVVAHSAEPVAARPLDNGAKKREGGSCGVVLRVTLIALRRRLLGGDAVAFACKPLRDIIAQRILGGRIGERDDDPRIEWHYHQIKTRGCEGVIMKIETA